MAAGAVRAFERLAWAWCLIAGAWIAGGSGAVAAAPLPPPEGLSEAERAEWKEVAAYVDGVFTRSRAGTVYPKARVTFREMLTYVPDEAEMARLRAAAEKEPDSMGAQLLRRYEATGRGQPETVERQLWIIDRNTFRSNFDINTEGSTTYIDSVFHGNKGYLWRFGHGGLTLTKDSAANIDRVAGYEERTFAMPISELLDPGFGIVTRTQVNSYKLFKNNQDKQLWIAQLTAESDGGVTRSIVFKWNSARRAPIVLFSRLDATTDFGPESSVETEYVGHEWREVASSYVARRVIQRNRAGAETRRLELVELAELTEQEFEEVASIPSAENPDPIRGDFGDRRVYEVAFEDLGIVPPEEKQSFKKGGHRWIGWSSVIAGIGVFGAIYVFRHRNRISAL